MPAKAATHTIIDALIVRNLCLVAVKDILQGIADLVNDTLAGSLELGELLGLLDKGI